MGVFLKQNAHLDYDDEINLATETEARHTFHIVEEKLHDSPRITI